jgi:hypothetical protein
MRRSLLLGALLLSGCAEGYGRYEPPVVDSYGVKPEKLAEDQHECIQRKKDHGFIGDARMITDCMEQKGYTILTPKG